MIKKIVGFGLVGTALVGGGILGGFYIGENVSIQQVEKAKDDYIKQGYEQGFQEALENKILLEKTIAEYKGKWETTKTELDGAKNQINILTDSNEGYVSQIESLTADKKTWQDKATALETANTTLQTEKSELQNSILADKAEIERLKATGTADKAEIERLENVVSQKESLISKYEETIQANLDSMANINDKLIEMGNKIAEMSNQVLLNNQTVSALNATIAKLEKTIAYYEQFIAQMENGEKVVATFKFDGSVVNMQIVEKGTCVSATTPTSTEHVIFNYWMLNGEEVDPATTPINSNTMFVANVTYKYDVNFIADGAQIGETQLIVKDGKAILPTAPTKEGYTFEGWTLNGTDVVDVENMQITANTTFVAKFSQLHTVIFVSENETISTQSIKAGQCAENVSLESTTHKVFNGWKLNGIIVNVEETPINGAVTFVADYTYKYDVIFMVEGEQYGETQIIVQNGKPTLPTAPTKEGYVFKGWTLNGEDVIEVSTYTIAVNTSFVAKFKKNLTSLVVKSWNGLTPDSGEYIWTDGENIYYSNNANQYVLDKATDTWVEKKWNGLDSFYGSSIFKDGEKIYVFVKSSVMFDRLDFYVLNKETDTWIRNSWDDFKLFSAPCVWTDGENIYFSDVSRQYVLDKVTDKWVEKIWNENIPKYGNCVWTDGENIYYSSKDEQYIFDKVTGTWVDKNWGGFNLLYGHSVWTDGENIYYSSNANQYVLDKTTDTWVEKVWDGFDLIFGAYVWTDGENYYYNYGDKSYIFV